MLRTTIGQLLVEDALPEELRGQSRVLDKKGLYALLQEVAERFPDKYREVSKKLLDIGRDAAFSTGSYSVGPESLRPSLAAQKMRLELGRELDQIYNDPTLDDDARDAAILKATGARQGKLADAVYDEAAAVGNPVAMMVKSGARGNKHNLNSLLGADLLYTDHKGNSIPVPVLRSYSQGLSPMEYFAGAFGARKGIIDIKESTQDAGALAKQLGQVTHRLLVTADDDDNPYDEAQPRGLPVDTDDPDSEGSLLSHPVGGYPRNTELTPKILKDLRNRGFDTILTRSPMVGGPLDGGVYARDAGRREKGRIAPIGDFIGLAGAQALAEPITQGQLASKHSGGIAGAAGAAAVSGFQALNQLVQVPKKFQGGAAHAQLDGRVRAVVAAPQGGHYVNIEGTQHYVPHHAAVHVKVGDDIEAGDVLSAGTPNPSEIVRHKGIGEGRMYFMQAFRKSLKDSGTPGHRRNIELLSRGLINHVRLTDELDDWVPDDVISYQALERRWEPREGNQVVPVAQAAGKYLERPVLHHTLGTKIRPSVVKQLQQYGVSQVTVHQEPPPFEPEMIRGMAVISHDEDPLTRMLGSYQSKSVLEAARRGATSDTTGTSYVPALASGTDFGRAGLTKGWKP